MHHRQPLDEWNLNVDKPWVLTDRVIWGPRYLASTTSGGYTCSLIGICALCVKVEWRATLWWIVHRTPCGCSARVSAWWSEPWCSPEWSIRFIWTGIKISTTSWTEVGIYNQQSQKAENSRCFANFQGCCSHGHTAGVFHQRQNSCCDITDWGVAKKNNKLEGFSPNKAEQQQFSVICDWAFIASWKIGFSLGLPWVSALIDSNGEDKLDRMNAFHVMDFNVRSWTEP